MEWVWLIGGALVLICVYNIFIKKCGVCRNRGLRFYMVKCGRCEQWAHVDCAVAYVPKTAAEDVAGNGRTYVICPQAECKKLRQLIEV